MPFGASRTSAFRQTPIRLLITEVGRAELTNWRTEGALAFAQKERPRPVRAAPLVSREGGRLARRWGMGRRFTEKRRLA
jgi:hypothetical protein